MTKILYVEDNDDNVFMLKPRLQRRGFEVVIAYADRGVASRAIRVTAAGRLHAANEWVRIVARLGNADRCVV